MDFETWEPVYEAILADMGYDRDADEAARDDLARLVDDAPTVEPEPDAMAGRTVAIAAPGRSLDPTDSRLAAADTTIAAGPAADRLRAAGVAPDWVVTDLDGHPTAVRGFTADGMSVAVHAHGDNRALLEAHVPSFELSVVLPTTQAGPVGPVRNFGGFTDGDRAAFLADALGADRLVFPGWDLGDPSVGPEKRRKLDWAARLLHWLERRRDESFSVLDECREDLDMSAIPTDG